ALKSDRVLPEQPRQPLQQVSPKRPFFRYPPKSFSRFRTLLDDDGLLSVLSAVTEFPVLITRSVLDRQLLGVRPLKLVAFRTNNARASASAESTDVLVLSDRFRPSLSRTDPSFLTFANSSELPLSNRESIIMAFWQSQTLTKRLYDKC